MTNMTPLRVIFPAWFKEVLRTDIALAAGGLDTYSVTDAQVDQLFRGSNVNPTWALDGEAGQDYSRMTDLVVFAGQTGEHRVIAEYPGEVIWYLFAEGTFSFMDGGTLDLGLVRDSTLNAANDYQTFVETFENAIKFDNESIRFRSRYVPTGSGSTDVTIVPAPGLPVTTPLPTGNI